MKLFQSNDNTQDTNTFKFFQFPIGNEKCVETFKFQVQYARSKQWFGIDLDWIEVNFSTRELDFYKETFSKPLRYTRY